MNSSIRAAVACVCMLAPALVYGESLFEEAKYKSIITDHRAYKQGDVLTVLIYESATAASSTNADTQKSTDVDISVAGSHKQREGQLGLSSGFNGGGELSRSDEVKATVSVTVTEVMDDGYLFVKGLQKIGFNEESQLISIEGRVRPIDISPQNTILSSRIADVQIEYTGDGLLSNRQKPGVITRFFNWLF